MTVEPAYNVRRFNGYWLYLMFTATTEQETESQKREQMRQEISCHKKNTTMTDKTN